MNTTESALVVAPGPQQFPTGRVVFTQGGKGGVGKTAFTSLLVEWYARQGLRYALLDLDTENKTRGSLAHFFPEARKVNIHTSEGLDAFVDVLDHAPLVIADMGAGAGQVAAEWFEAMAGPVSEMGVAFTAIGVVTPDPASVESVCAWADALQDQVSYLIVKNALTNPAHFSYWDESRQARSFREALKPKVIAME
jgi:MinD-like ATPase involved in chromosome partitioning or flagellar assembly